MRDDIQSQAPTARLHTHSGAHGLRVRLAAGFLDRFMGLMLRRALASDGALLIAGCSSVHTAFMRFAIDIVYLDAHGVVLKCVTAVRPWRGSISWAGRDTDGSRHRCAAHALELAAGGIARWGIAAGDRLEHPLWFARAAVAPRVDRQRGAALIEFVVVGPILTVLGLALTQYSMLFFAKNQIDHAAFMAARAGSVGNASLAKVGDAYALALVPLYGGGKTPAELAASLVKAQTEVAQNSRIELLNPTKQSFDDWNDPALQLSLGTGAKRVISNSNLAFRGNTVGPNSGQNAQDANLIKLRIMHGYQPVVPIVASIYKAYLTWQDTGSDAFRTQLIKSGRIPVVSDVTLQMQSDAIEPDNPVSSPGAGDGGNPVNPGDPPVVSTPPPDPDCPLGGCTTSPAPPPGSGGTCPAMMSTTFSADALFGFDQATLQSGGKKQLDDLIAKAKASGTQFDTLTVTGYTDPIGTADYNLTLSQSRAQAVRDYLLSNGLTADHVNVVGAGATKLIVPEGACAGKTGVALQSCYAEDRRVTVQLTPKS